MRGYFTFVLVFISIFLLLTLLKSFSSVNPGYSKEIAIERAYQLQLNAKDAILEAARQGAKKGWAEYSLAHASGGYNMEDAKNAARKGAFESISLLADWEFDPAFEVILWCGYTGEPEIKELKGKMMAEKIAKTCANCMTMDSNPCEEYVNIEISLQGEVVFIWLGANNPSNPFEQGIVGISVYSDKFGIAGASYIPQNEKKRFL